MKRIFIFFLSFTCYFFTNAQDLNGSWELAREDGKIPDQTAIRIYQDNYFTEGVKDADDQFISAKGGMISNNGTSYSEHYEFDTANKEMVGTSSEFAMTSSGDSFRLQNGENSQVWKKISENIAPLAGNWVITGRKRNGEMNTMTPGDRRTLKVLGGGKFQWIAFNSATGDFYGTGGGSYTAEKGKYTEHIEFFSRDDSRVGASLVFDFELIDGEWHHSGKSSKGDPMYEIWSTYKAEQFH